MPLSRAARLSHALPVSQDEFASALWRAFDATFNTQVETRPHRMKWGIAVSGGVDSMSAAYLCAQMQRQDPAEPCFTAFVVDHSARKASADESRKVVKMLQALGLEAHSLLLRWPEHIEEPLKLPNFETLARKMRFHALGHACAKHDIQNLILGHHADDMVETAVFRLLKGGFSDVSHTTARIPECKGIPYVDNRLRGLLSCDSPRNTQQSHSRSAAVPLAERGITTHKPLHQFDKTRLISTCLHNGVDWIEDQTNKDPSLTTRNAIRFLFKENALPRALQKDSFLNLAQGKSKGFKDADARAMACLQRIDGNLDMPLGILTLKLHSHHKPHRAENGLAQTTSHFDFEQILEKEPLTGIALVKHIVRMVQPYSVLGNEKMKRIVSRLLEITRTSKHKSRESTFNFGNVQWYHERKADGVLWKLSRQRPARGTDIIRPEWTAKDLGQWKLFDDRFWIHIGPGRELHGSNLADAESTIAASDLENAPIIRAALQNGLETRLLCETALCSFRRGLRRSPQGKKTLEIMDQTLSSQQLGSSRWTLPVIAVKGSTTAILGFATMDWRLQGVERWFRWQAQYAFTDIPGTFLHKQE